MHWTFKKRTVPTCSSKLSSYVNVLNYGAVVKRLSLFTLLLAGAQVLSKGQARSLPKNKCCTEQLHTPNPKPHSKTPATLPVQTTPTRSLKWDRLEYKIELTVNEKGFRKWPVNVTVIIIPHANNQLPQAHLHQSQHNKPWTEKRWGSGQMNPIQAP